MTDFVRDNSVLCLGSRLRRIGERLQASVQVINTENGIDLSPHLCAALATLDASGPLTVGELAASLGVSQPGVTRSVRALITEKLAIECPTAHDQRKKRVELTAKGKDILAALRTQTWPHIETAVQEACNGQADALVRLLDTLEDALQEASLRDRVAHIGAPAMQTEVQ